MRSQVEVLLMLAQNAQTDGDELAAEDQRRVAERDRVYFAHAKRLLELSTMIDHARLVIETEKARFARWLPQEASNAAQGGLGSLHDQREHSRASPPRLASTQSQANSGNRAVERSQDSSRAAETQAR